MSSQWIRFGLILTAVALLAAGCAPTQVAPPSAAIVSSQAAVSSAPTATAIPSSTPASATGTSSGGDVVRLVVVPEKSEARYRVREQLANVSLPNDAIGRTKEVSGTIVLKTDGSIVSPDSQFVVGLQTLQTDRSQRDNFVRRNVLQIDQFPTAIFVPTQATGLPSPLPQSGDVTFKLIGDLTIRNVTKQVTWDVTGKIQGNELAGQATTSFKFDYFGLTQPKVPVVLSVEDHIQLELDMVLQRVNN
jgi:polyisoprenoid-binding protein YceI